MADTSARDAIQRGIAAWLPTMSEDELRVVDAVVTELLVRREHDTKPIDRIEVGLAELAHAPAVSRTPAGDIVIGPFSAEYVERHERGQARRKRGEATEPSSEHGRKRALLERAVALTEMDKADQETP